MPIPIPRPMTANVPPYGGGNGFLQYLMQMFGRMQQQRQQNTGSMGAPVPRPGMGAVSMRPGMPARMGMSAAQTTPRVGAERPLGPGETPYNRGQTPADAARFLSMANPDRRSSVPAGAIVHGVSAGGEPLWSFPHPGVIMNMAHPTAYHGQGPMTPEQSARITAATNYRPGSPVPPPAPRPGH